MVFPVARIGNLWNRSPFSFSKKRALLWYRYAGRDEVRRLTRESASDDEKKDDTAYTCAKFVHLPCEGTGKLRRGRQRMECERKNN